MKWRFQHIRNLRVGKDVKFLSFFIEPHPKFLKMSILQILNLHFASWNRLGETLDGRASNISCYASAFTYRRSFQVRSVCGTEWWTDKHPMTLLKRENTPACVCQAAEFRSFSALAWYTMWHNATEGDSRPNLPLPVGRQWSQLSAPPTPSPLQSLHWYFHPLCFGSPMTKWATTLGGRGKGGCSILQAGWCHGGKGGHPVIRLN